MDNKILKRKSDAEVKYADIINLPHHKSKKYEPMSLYDRAAQFAPFAALTGYDEMIEDEARYVDSEITLDEAAIELLNLKLNIIEEAINDGATPTISVTYFEPDKTKSGGKYINKKIEIKKIDKIKGVLVLTNKIGRGLQNETIDLNKIIRINGELVDYIDDNQCSI